MFSSIFRVKFNGLLCFALHLKPIAALHIMKFLKLSKLLGGGGGAERYASGGSHRVGTLDMPSLLSRMFSTRSQ